MAIVIRVTASSFIRTIRFFYGNGGLHTYEGFSFCTDGDDEMDSLFYFDNFVFEIVPKEDKPHPVMPSATVVGSEDSATVKVLNYGTPYDFSISMLDLPGNVSVSPASGRTEDSTDLTFTVNREGLEENYYRARVRMAYSDGDAELTNTFPLGVSNEFIGKDASVRVDDGILLVIYPRFV